MKINNRSTGALSAVLFIVNILVFLPPFLIKAGYFKEAELVYLLFSPFCHQLTERSFHIFSAQLALCARCTGIWAGLLLGTLFFIFFKPEISSWLLLPVLVMIIDGIFNAVSGFSTPAFLRFFFGAGFGFSGGWILARGFYELEENLKREKWKTKSTI